MERVRKRLGECVPIEAVFRDDEEAGSDHEGDRGYSNSVAQFSSLEAVSESPYEHSEVSLAPGLTYTSRPLPQSWGRRVFNLIKKD